MRLQHVHISDYKNLKDFELSFENDSFLDVFVGKNGTGKSNLFEALIEIFRHLNEFDSGGAEIDFDYSIVYEVQDKETTIEWTKGQLNIDGKDRKTVGKTPVPDNVLVYYSGHNDTVSNLIRAYEKDFRSRIKGADLTDSRYFLGIGPEYKQLFLVVSLLKPDDSPCRRFICQKLGIAETGNELRIVLKRPYYAQDNPKYDVENNDEKDRFWKAEGITKKFLDSLLECPAPEPKDGRVRTEGFQAGDDQYILYVDTAALQDKFKDKAPHELFDRFDGLKVLEMLDDISIPLKLTNGEEANTTFFSDGQFQSVYIFAITELFKERHCLTLLDEPDSFLHPEWQHEFLSQISDISASATKTNHILLSSHSASTISSSDESQISLFEIDGNTVKVSHAHKGQIINSLSAGLIAFSESEARLNIQHVLTNTTGPVLFTEGITDEIILETAWSKLYPTEDCPFEIQNAFDCAFLANLLQRDSLYLNHPQRVFFGLFDFDTAYNEWSRLRGADEETDPCKCLTKKHATHEGYGLLLPVPASLSIKNQVLNPATNSTYKHKSLLTIELLFHDVPGLGTHFIIDTERTDGFKKFAGDKVKFAKSVIQGLAPKHFKHFEPIFDFVKSKCASPTPAAP